MDWFKLLLNQIYQQLNNVSDERRSMQMNQERDYETCVFLVPWNYCYFIFSLSNDGTVLLCRILTKSE